MNYKKILILAIFITLHLFQTLFAQENAKGKVGFFFGGIGFSNCYSDNISWFYRSQSNFTYEFGFYRAFNLDEVEKYSLRAEMVTKPLLATYEIANGVSSRVSQINTAINLLGGITLKHGEGKPNATLMLGPGFYTVSQMRYPESNSFGFENSNDGAFNLWGVNVQGDFSLLFPFDNYSAGISFRMFYQLPFSANPNKIPAFYHFGQLMVLHIRM